MTETHIIEYDVKEATLKELAIKRDSVIAQYNQGKDIEIVKIAKREIAKLRNAIEKRRKEYKADALEYGRKVDSEAKKASEPVAAIEQSYDDVIRAYDDNLARLAREAQEKEDARIATIKSEMDLYLCSGIGAGFSSTELKSELEHLRDYNKDGFDYEEFTQEMQDKFKEKESYIKAQLESRLKYESEQSELIDQRKKDDAERAKFEAEKAAFEKTQAEASAKLQAERDAIDAEKRDEQEKLRHAEIERERKGLEELRERDRLKRIEAEKAESERLAQLEKEDAERKAKQESEDRIRNAAPELLDALIYLYGQSRDIHGVVSEYVAMPCKSLEEKFPTSLYRLQNQLDKAAKLINELKGN